ncbi:glycosyl hydrolase family 61-domain-containing protein [Ephemerocybe angulata]|uniref:AA9 family lytic polysaccharide monooxygenase n=1 Tax=Ephemerocybe angulata TaxID=980116 RepID=A0A8H6M8V4_9AGAR|nr:glycosyl hydrolase family 61-domain-containing protein [Tulosesus angulatus]
MWRKRTIETGFRAQGLIRVSWAGGRIQPARRWDTPGKDAGGRATKNRADCDDLNEYMRSDGERSEEDEVKNRKGRDARPSLQEKYVGIELRRHAACPFHRKDEAWIERPVSGILAKVQWGNGLIMKSPAYDMTSIPASLASGEYLMRHDSELLALHQANTPQFYPECAGLIRSGGGSANPGARFKTKFPGGCSMSDPGVKLIPSPPTDFQDPRSGMGRPRREEIGISFLTPNVNVVGNASVIKCPRHTVTWTCQCLMFELRLVQYWALIGIDRRLGHLPSFLRCDEHHFYGEIDKQSLTSDYHIPFCIDQGLWGSNSLLDRARIPHWRNN